MNDRERYYQLDDLMPIGSQKKISKRKAKAIAKETAKFIEAFKKAEAERKAKKEA